MFITFDCDPDTLRVLATLLIALAAVTCLCRAWESRRGA